MQEIWIQLLGGKDLLEEISCLGNPMDRGAWQAYSPWGHKEQTRLTLSLSLVAQ